MIFKAAGITVEVNGLNSAYLKHRLNNYLVTEVSGDFLADLRVTFQQNNGITVPEGKDFHWLDAWYWIDRGSQGYTGIQQTAKERVNVIRADIDFSCTQVMLEYGHIRNTESFAMEYMLFRMLGSMFSFCQTVRNAVVLHSAAVAYKGQAVLFSAPSGTGKSTHTSLWKKYYTKAVTLFNDDTPIIRPVGETLYACGTPWSGKTEINENIEAPLKAIVFLKQAPENSIRCVPPMEAMMLLMNQTRRHVFEHLMNQHIDILHNIVTKIPIYELGCTISKEAVDLVKQTVFEE